MHESLTEESHSFISKGTRISAIWHHSSQDAPVVILHHGFTEDKVEHHRIFVKLARRLAKEGFDTFRFDFYGSGDSEGTLFDATFSTWINNAIDAAAYVRSKGKSKILTLGFSLGGFVAAATAPTVKPARMVLWAPIFHPLKRILKEQHLIKEGQRSGCVNFKGEKLSLVLVKDAAKFKIPKLFAGYQGSILLLHGTEDVDALPEESHAYQAFYAGNQKLPVDLRFIQGANHTFDHYDWEAEVIENTVSWLLASNASF